MAKALKNNLSLIFVVILAIIPLILWSFMSPLTLRFSSASMIFRSLGQLTGLLGTALLSMNFILSARFRFLDKLFNGLNVVYVKHHLIGAISFCLLLFHPVFLIIQYLCISLKSAFLFIFSIENLAINLGKISLLVFILLMVFTFYFNFKYQIWKNTHKYLGIVLLLGGLHMLLVPSDISNNAILKYYMLGLAIIGAYSYFYRTIFGIYKKREYEYRLEKVIRVSNDVVELKLSPVAKKIKFIPGQFVFLRVGTKGVLSESHPFSIISHPDDDNLSFGIKALGDYTGMIYLLKSRVTCFVEGPFGSFSYLNATSRRQIWIAGGIGVTPFLSMARQINFNKKDGDYKIDLYYSVKNDDDMAFGGELVEISKQNNNFKFYQHFSDRDGRVSANLISKKSEDVFQAEIFLCGPSDFMQNLREQFIKLGFTNDRIYSEEFNF